MFASHIIGRGHPDEDDGENVSVVPVLVFWSGGFSVTRFLVPVMQGLDRFPAVG